MISLGGEKVILMKEEIQHLKNYGKPCFKLIGFKPRRYLQDFHNIKPSYFIYPDDKRITDSSKVFDALLKQMTIKGKVGIGKIVPKETNQIRLVALLPQLENYDEQHMPTPPGFHLIFLPFADDLRKPEMKFPKEKLNPNSSQHALSKILVNSLTRDIKPSNFEDPARANFFIKMQASAMGQPIPEEFDDKLSPDEETMRQYEPVVKAFYEDFWGNDDKRKKRGALLRRAKKLEDELLGRNRKKGKRKINMDDLESIAIEPDSEESDKEEEVHEIEYIIRRREYYKLKHEHLRFFLKMTKQDYLGKKEILLERAIQLVEGAHAVPHS